MTKKKVVFKLTSNEWVHTPGIINWALRGMKPMQARRFIKTAYPQLSAKALDNLIMEDFRVEGSQVVVEG